MPFVLFYPDLFYAYFIIVIDRRITLNPSYCPLLRTSLLFHTFNKPITHYKSLPTRPLFAGSLFDQFLFIVRKVIEDFDFLWSTVSLPQTIRCLFETRHNSNHRVYLLVQVMTKNLEMWRSLEADQPLSRVEAMKVLFQPIENRGVDPDVVVPVPPLILSWENDSTVNHVRISAAMMEAAIGQLEQRADMLPECYRKAGASGFRLSYLYGVDDVDSGK